MMLDLMEAGLDVVGMDNNVTVWVQDPEVVCPDKDGFAHINELAFEFQAVQNGCHDINGDEIPTIYV
jgi:hypothetical protein